MATVCCRVTDGASCSWMNMLRWSVDYEGARVALDPMVCSRRNRPLPTYVQHL